jgi:TetR/AcrR family transcriptional regulator, lmrAB and yxaGH operons repressor
MARPKIEDEELAETLSAVFRRLGYEGATLGIIAKSSGLEKASLYHRFPGGKDEMLAVSMSQVQKNFLEKVLEPLTTAGAPAERLKLAQQGLREFYWNGELPCVLDTLSLPPASNDTTTVLRQAYSAWLDALARLARDAGATPSEARRRAQRAIVLIEGSLVVSRATGDDKPFRQTVSALTELLLEGNG